MRWNAQKGVGLTASLGLIVVVGYFGLEAVQKSNIEFLGIRWGVKPEPYIGVKVGFKESSMLTREVSVSPRGLYAVELCRTPVVPGETKREYDFTGYYDWTNVTRLLRRGNSCR